MDKKVLRERILGKRSQLTKEEVLNKSHIMAERLYSLDEYIKAKFIFSFISFKDEVHTHEMIRNSLKLGKRVGVPIAIPKTRIMNVSELMDFDEELKVGFYNILTPKDEYIRIAPPEAIDLVLVPGVAFDRRGYRIGYGGGYYDTFFSKMDRGPVKIGLCFDKQMILKVPTDPHDIAVDLILTEEELIICD